MEKKAYSAKEWMAEGKRRFGENFESWRFVCPKCGNVASGAEFKELGADINVIYSECIGRYDKNKGCNWAAYGLFDICTVHVDGMPVFDFTEIEEVGE